MRAPLREGYPPEAPESVQIRREWRSDRTGAASGGGAHRLAGRADGPVAGAADEVENFLNDRVLAELLADILDALGERALVGKKQTVGTPEVMDFLAAETAPAQPDDVEAGQVGPVAQHHAIGNDVVLHSREAADEGVRAVADVLMQAGAAADDGEIADLAMTGEHGVVRHDHIVADAAVVRHVRIGEKK